MLVACDLSGKATGAFDETEEQVIDTSSLLKEDGTLEGTGRFLAPNSLGQVRGSRSFHLNFKLVNDGSSLTLTAFANQELLEGVGLEFIRVADQLEVRIFGGGTEITIRDRFTQIRADRTIELMIDIHNDHDDAAHLFIWPYLGDAARNYGPQNALVNTDFFKLPDFFDGFDFPDWHDQSVKGNGPFWGLDLDDVIVDIFKVGPPKDNS
jgi:hypothetical protein